MQHDIDRILCLKPSKKLSEPGQSLLWDISVCRSQAIVFRGDEADKPDRASSGD